MDLGSETPKKTRKPQCFLLSVKAYVLRLKSDCHKEVLNEINFYQSLVLKTCLPARQELRQSYLKSLGADIAQDAIEIKNTITNHISDTLRISAYQKELIKRMLPWTIQ